MAEPAARPFPAGALVRAAWHDTLVDRVPLIRAGALWAIASLVADGLALLLSGPAPAEDADPAGGALSELIGLPLLLVGWVGLSALTVCRLRALLAAAPPPSVMAPLDRHVARYMLAEMVLGALAALPLLAALALLGPAAGIPAAMLAGTIGAAMLFARLHLVLVGAALGAPGMSLSRSWRLTAGVWPTIALALIACAAPLGLASGSIGGWLVDRGAPLTGSALATAGAFAQAAVLATFLAASWRHFTSVSLQRAR